MRQETIAKNTAKIKEKARALGFSAVGVSEADFLEDEAEKLENWLKAGKHGKMQYLENYFDKRLDPRKLVPGAQSVISLALNYYPEKTLNQAKDTFKIARYAYGEDYHFFIKRKLKTLLAFINTEIGEVNGRVFVDSAPVMERKWAEKSGLGWQGKNTLLINKQKGSYFFLAELILDLPLTPDHSLKDYCGSCTRCIDACPTEALTPYNMDARRCIAYLTIELKDNIPEDFKNTYQDWIFGCDICQEVCPWNRLSVAHRFPELKPSAEVSSLDKEAWQEITEDVFQKIFKKSPLKRTKIEGIRRNINFLTKETH